LLYRIRDFETALPEKSSRPCKGIHITDTISISHHVGIDALVPEFSAQCSLQKTVVNGQAFTLYCYCLTTIVVLLSQHFIAPL